MLDINWEGGKRRREQETFGRGGGGEERGGQEPNAGRKDEVDRDFPTTWPDYEILGVHSFPPPIFFFF